MRMSCRPASRRTVLLEVLLWLGERGFHFLPPAALSPGQRCAACFQRTRRSTGRWERLAHETAPPSIATLRRRLAAEGVTYRNLVQDVRMSHALAMLQNTDVPVLQIALAAGYASASRFSRAVSGALWLFAHGHSRPTPRASFFSASHKEISMLKIHHLGHSQSERIGWLCEELGVPYEMEKHTRDPVTRSVAAGAESAAPARRGAGPSKLTGCCSPNRRRSSITSWRGMVVDV